jgi:pimeloyl-ACP methyl ester carboxylesterase
MRYGRAILGWFCALAAVGAAPFAPAHAQTLVLERCKLETQGIQAAFARCGTLAVPEDPAAPAGPTIEIFVARIGALSATPKPDPLLLIAGGPGQSTVDFYLQLRGAFEQARRDRDIVLVDQRGTGGSHPLDCDLFGPPADIQSYLGASFRSTPSAGVATRSSAALI